MFTRYFEVISQALSTLNEGSVIALAALFLVLALGEFGVPFPFVLQGVLFFVGYHIFQAKQVIPVLLILILGRQFGSGIVYWLARLVGNPFISWYGKHFSLLRSRLDSLKDKLNKQTPLAIVVGRLTPGLLVPTSLLSGAMRLRYRYFALGILLSAVIWDWIFIAFGIISAQGAHHLGLASYHWFIPAIGFVIAMVLSWAVGRYI